MSASFTRKNRSLKFVTQRKSAVGTSGIPKWFISRRRLAVELEAELLAPVAEQREVHDERAGEVADDHADRPLVERDDEEQRRADREEDVREARETNATDRSSTRKSEVSCS